MFANRPVDRINSLEKEIRKLKLEIFDLKRMIRNSQEKESTKNAK